MPKLVDEFGEAARRWCEHAGEGAETNLAFHGMAVTGGSWHVAAIGARSLESFPESERAGLKVGDLTGRRTLDQLLDYLRALNIERHISETVLVPGVVAAMDATLDEAAEDYTKGRRRARTEAERMRRGADDPAFIERLAEIARASGKDAPDRARLTELAEFLERMGQSNVIEQADRVRQRELWRQEMAPIISPLRLSEAYSDEVNELGERYGWPRLKPRDDVDEE